MAQIGRRLAHRLPGLAALWLAAAIAAVAPASAQVPDEGLRAEGEDRWEDALEVYRDVLDEDPARPALWLRVADIEARLEHPDEAADAIRRAAELRPEDVGLQVRLSQAMAAANRPEEAIAAIERAAALDPANPDHLRARAQLAQWMGDAERVADSYARLEEMGEPEGTLGLARIAAWNGRIADAIERYRLYLARVPEDDVAWLELVRQEAWRGNASGAMEVLERYRERFGETLDYRVERARVLVVGGRPLRALEVLAPVLEERPDDYETRLVHALALREAGRATGTLAEADAIGRMAPDDDRTVTTVRYLRAPFRSTLAPGFQYYRDSDEIERLVGSVEAGIAVTPVVRLAVGVDLEELRVETGSSFAALDGRDVRATGGDAGLEISPGGRVSFSGRVGGAAVEDGREILTYDAALVARPTDAAQLTVGADRAFHDVSPLALDLGIHRTRGQLRIDLAPGFDWRLDAAGTYETYSDDNARTEARAGVRRAILRRQAANLDLGAFARWFSFEDDLDNGYYDPEEYEHYGVVLSSYFKVSDASGIALEGSGGFFRDETQDFEPSGTVQASGTFGIFSDWMLVVRAAYLDNTRTETGAFRAFGGGVVLTRRF